MSEAKRRRIIFLSTGLAILAILIGSVTKTIAAPGDLDPTFGNGGKVISSIVGSNYDAGFAMAYQADGKIVVAGRSSPNSTRPSFSVIRYNSNGTLDTTFGTGGWVTTQVGNFSSVAESVAIQPDGKIVVAGVATTRQTDGLLDEDFAVVRYNSDGSLDTSFDGDGKAITQLGEAHDFAASVIIQSDGKIVAAGYSLDGGLTNGNFAIVRYNTDGTLDTTFDGDGKVFTDIGGAPSDFAHSVAIQPDGKIVVGGESNFLLAVVRYNSDGSLDATFGNGGIVTTSVPGYDGSRSLAKISIQPDGKIVGAGTGIPPGNLLSGDFIVVRYNPNGSLDSSFDNDGIVTTAISGGFDNANSMAIQSNGKIVVVGRSRGKNTYDFSAVRYNSNGSLDSGFGNGGIIITPVGTSNDAARSVAIQPNGKIILAGFSNNGAVISFALVHYQGENHPLFDFDGDGKTDFAVFRPSDSFWYLNHNNNSFDYVRFGLSTDRIVPADYDGDGKTDVAVFRPIEGTWYLQRSQAGFLAYQFGLAGDIPAPSDYDGDGKADLAVFRPSDGTWHIQGTRSGYRTLTFGQNGDVPVNADYDADGKADIALWRPSNGFWYIMQSSNNIVRYEPFGMNGDLPVVGDYDGDQKADLVVYRPTQGIWYLQQSRAGFRTQNWGLPDDRPASGDYDGDGKMDIAVWRGSDGFFYIYTSGGSIIYQRWGVNGDRPIAAAYVTFPITIQER